MNRLIKLQEQLSNINQLPAIISKPENIGYLTNFWGSSALLLLTEKKIYFFTDGRYIEYANKILDEHYIDIVKIKRSYFAPLRNIVKGNVLYVEHHFITMEYFSKLQKKLHKEIKPLDKPVEEMRRVKDREEISSIKKSVEITKCAFDYILNKSLRLGVSERDIAIDMEYFMKMQGADELAFDIIVAFGKNSSVPHYQTGKAKLQKGDIVLIDAGCKYNKYCSDRTRTIVFQGHNENKFEKRYNWVNDAKRLAEDLINSGERDARKIDIAVRNFFNKYNIGDNYLHSLGHSVGLEIHEEPNLTAKKSYTLTEGNVFTIEPGLYFEGWGGIRIEDMYTIEDNRLIML